jgi:hypothetical protein
VAGIYRNKKDEMLALLPYSPYTIKMEKGKCKEKGEVWILACNNHIVWKCESCDFSQRIRIRFWTKQCPLYGVRIQMLNGCKLRTKAMSACAKALA